MREVKPEPDQILLERYQAQQQTHEDMDLFVPLVTRFSKPLLEQLTRRYRRKPFPRGLGPEDLTHDILLSLHQDLQSHNHQGDPIRSLTARVQKFLHNELNNVKRRKHEQLLEDDSALSLPAHPPQALEGEPEQRLYLRQLNVAFEDCLARLEAHDPRLALVMQERRLGGSFKVIAHKLGAADASGAKRISDRAEVLMKKCLHQKGFTSVE